MGRAGATELSDTPFRPLLLIQLYYLRELYLSSAAQELIVFYPRVFNLSGAPLIRIGVNSIWILQRGGIAFSSPVQGMC